MSKYKKIMQEKGIMQKEVLDAVHHNDPRVDKSLLSKIVNDICLPTPPTLEVICATLLCDVADIYDPREITLAPKVTNQAVATVPAPSSKAERERQRRIDKNLYNLTVEIPRALAERVFTKEALRKAGYLSKSDFVRRCVEELDEKLKALERHEKTAENVKALQGGD